MLWLRNKIRPTGRIINLWEHTSWGNSIYFSDFETRRLVGWLKHTPKVGDEVRSKMKSGKIARFLITNVERMHDPSDMFFADVKDVDYL